jgi:hypothetical protein
MVKTKSRKRNKSRNQHKLKKRRKSRKRIKTRRCRKLKYRGGGKNDKLICHIIKLIESIPKEDSSTPRPRVTSPRSAKQAEIRQAAIRQDEILWKEAGVKKLRKWADKFLSSFCSEPWIVPTSDSQDSESDEDEDEDEDEYKNRKPPPPP